MTTSPLTTDTRGFRAPGTTFMVAGGLLGAIGAYLFQVYGTRNLDPDAFAPVSVLWTAFFILVTVLLVPLEQYVTREVASGRKVLPGDLTPILAMTGSGVVVGAVFVLATLDTLFAGDPSYVIQIVLLMIGYSLLVVGKGVLAGSRRFAGVGWILVVESLARLAAGVLFLSLVLDASSLGWAMVVGGFSVLGLRWWNHDRGDLRVPAAPAGSFLAGYVGGTSSSQILLGGAPIAVAALGGSPALVSIVFVTFTLYRAPLTLIFALQGRILPYLVALSRDANTPQLSRIARNVVVGGVGMAAVGGLVGWVIGSDVVGLLYGNQYAPAAIVAMWSAAGVMAAAAAQIVSQVLVAEARTSRLAWAWMGGLVMAIAVGVLIGGEPDSRVALAFAGGELTSLALMGWFAIRR